VNKIKGQYDLRTELIGKDNEEWDKEIEAFMECKLKEYFKIQKEKVIEEKSILEIGDKVMGKEEVSSGSGNEE